MGRHGSGRGSSYWRRCHVLRRSYTEGSAIHRELGARLRRHDTRRAGQFWDQRGHGSHLWRGGSRFQFQLDIPATVMGQATDTIRADSPSSESDDGAVMVDGQPQLAPEKAEQSAPVASWIERSTRRAPGDSAATSAVELSGSTIAAPRVCLAASCRLAAAEKERRGVRRVN